MAWSCTPLCHWWINFMFCTKMGLYLANGEWALENLTNILEAHQCWFSAGSASLRSQQTQYGGSDGGFVYMPHASRGAHILWTIGYLVRNMCTGDPSRWWLALNTNTFSASFEYLCYRPLSVRGSTLDVNISPWLINDIWNQNPHL